MIRNVCQGCSLGDGGAYVMCSFTCSTFITPLVLVVCFETRSHCVASVVLELTGIFLSQACATVLSVDFEETS